MICRGCDTPIDSATYCERCREEVDFLLSARPFVWPEWIIILRNVVCGFLLILLIAFCFFAIAALTPDTNY